jgi:hypothetical protein
MSPYCDLKTQCRYRNTALQEPRRGYVEISHPRLGGDLLEQEKSWSC